MKRTDIEWTDLSANPLKYRDAAGKVVWACVKKSTGCANCYSEAIAHHYDRGGPFTKATMEGLTPFLDDADLKKILTAKTIDKRPAAGSKCFLGDMTDIFGEWVPDEHLDRLFATVALRPDVTFQVLTKRPDRMRLYFCAPDVGRRIYAVVSKWLDDGDGGFLGRDWLRAHTLAGWAATFDANGWHLPLPNLWLGTSAENQPCWDERIPHLRATPAAIRFVSVEPQVGDINATPLILCPYCHGSGEIHQEHDFTAEKVACPCMGEKPIHWMIIGGESGHGSRPMQLGWARSLVEQCKAADVACFVKQLGAHCVARLTDVPDEMLKAARSCGQGDTALLIELGLKDKKGGNPEEWPEALRVREFPKVSA